MMQRTHSMSYKVTPVTQSHQAPTLQRSHSTVYAVQCVDPVSVSSPQPHETNNEPTATHVYQLVEQVNAPFQNQQNNTNSAPATKTYSFHNPTYTQQVHTQQVHTQQTQVTQQEDSSSLPAGWLAVRDQSTHKVYYWNKDTNQTSWKKPAAAAVPAAAAAASSSASVYSMAPQQQQQQQPSSLSAVPATAVYVTNAPSYVSSSSSVAASVAGPTYAYVSSQQSVANASSSYLPSQYVITTPGRVKSLIAQYNQHSGHSTPSISPQVSRSVSRSQSGSMYSLVGSNDGLPLSPHTSFYVPAQQQQQQSQSTTPSVTYTYSPATASSAASVSVSSPAPAPQYYQYSSSASVSPAPSSSASVQYVPVNVNYVLSSPANNVTNVNATKASVQGTPSYATQSLTPTHVQPQYVVSSQASVAPSVTYSAAPYAYVSPMRY